MRQWVTHLAQDNYDSALRGVATNPYQAWTPQLLRAVVAGYGLPEPHRSGISFRVTPPEQATGGPPQHVVHREQRPNGALGHVEYDLPLNGEWSDLTATFFLRADASGLYLELDEVHVF